MQKINTGGQFDMQQRSSQSTAIPTTTRTVLFDATATNTTSRVVTVGDGKAIILDAYNLQPDAVIQVNRVSVGTRPTANGRACCMVESAPNLYEVRPADILFRQPMIIGGHHWLMTHNEPQMLIALPGTYEFVLNDPVYLDGLYVEFYEVQKHQWPDVYLSGVREIS